MSLETQLLGMKTVCFAPFDYTGSGLPFAAAAFHLYIDGRMRRRILAEPLPNHGWRLPGLSVEVVPLVSLLTLRLATADGDESVSPFYDYEDLRVASSVVETTWPELLVANASAPRAAGAVTVGPVKEDAHV